MFPQKSVCGKTLSVEANNGQNLSDKSTEANNGLKYTPSSKKSIEASKSLKDDQEMSSNGQYVSSKKIEDHSDKNENAEAWKQTRCWKSAPTSRNALSI